MTPEEQKVYDRGYEAGTVNYVCGEELNLLRELAEVALEMNKGAGWNALCELIEAWRKLQEGEDGEPNAD